MKHLILGAAYGTTDVTTNVQYIVGRKIIEAGLHDEILALDMPVPPSEAANAEARARSLDERLRKLPLPVPANSGTFGDPSPGNPKTLVVVYEYEGKPRVEIVQEGATLQLRASLPGDRPAAKAGELTILGAAYGLGDITAKARSLVRNNKLEVTADNATWGDTWADKKKTLVIVYQAGGEPRVATAAEGSRLTLQP